MRKCIPVSSVANRANHSSRIASNKSIRRNILRDDGTRRDDRILPHGYATDNGRTRCDPYVSLNHDGLSNGDGPSLRRFNRMARRDEAHIRPDQNIVSDVESAKVIEGAVLIDEDVAPDAYLVPTGSKKRRDQQKALVYLLPGKLAEQRPNFIRIVERQAVHSCGDRRCSFYVCHHGR